jgi:hypothetical protein
LRRRRRPEEPVLEEGLGERPPVLLDEEPSGAEAPNEEPPGEEPELLAIVAISAVEGAEDLLEVISSSSRSFRTR